MRVRPITMTALAAFFALIPGALALERGSEANAPLARAILGGLLAGEPATLFVLPALYSLLIRDTPELVDERKRRDASQPAGDHASSRSHSRRRVGSQRCFRSRFVSSTRGRAGLREVALSRLDLQFIQFRTNTMATSRPIHVVLWAPRGESDMP